MKKPGRQPDGIPAHLRGEARRLWEHLVADFDIRDSGGLALVRVAAESFARAEEAREILSREGTIVRDRFGQAKTHPACLVERDSRTQLVSALRALKLSPEDLV